MQQFVEELRFMLLHSSPYYAQANGQAEAANKVLKEAIQKSIDDNPTDWHNVLS